MSEPQAHQPASVSAQIALARAAVIASGPLPRRLVRAGFDRLIRVLGQRHPEAFRRLSEMAPADLLIDPVDLPQAFVLSVGSPLRIGLADRNTPAQAAIRGGFPALLELFQGRIDGDALFFGRQLAMEGDTALVLAVRNILDGAEIDLAEDLLSLFGPLVPALRPGMLLARRVIPLLDDLLRTGLQTGRV